MRALAISDTHFGAWTGDPLLRHEFALEALAPRLDDVDELILLGDLFDFLFMSNTRNLRIIRKHLDKHHPHTGIIEQ